MGLMGLMGLMRVMRVMRRVNNNKVRARVIRGVLVLVILMTGLVACSGAAGSAGSDDSEPVAPVEQREAISFSSGLQEEQEITSGGSGSKKMTRAAGLESTATSFKVWGYKNDAVTGDNYTSYQTVFPGFTVNWTDNTAYSTTSNTHDWEYVGVTADQTIKYWDFSAKAYRFFGVAGSSYTTNAPTGNYETNGLTAATITANVDGSTTDGINAAPYFSELWFSTGNAVTYPSRQFGQAVQLVFLKPFARVRFMFTFAEGLAFGRELLTEPIFKPVSGTIATSGQVTVSYPLTGTATEASWSIENTSGITQFDIDYYDTPTPTVTPADDQATTWPNTPQKWYTVLPQSLGAFTVSVNVGTLQSTTTVPAEYMNWKAGYEYTYKFKILEGGGVVLEIVQVGINTWENKKNVDHTVYNW